MACVCLCAFFFFHKNGHTVVHMFLSTHIDPPIGEESDDSAISFMMKMQTFLMLTLKLTWIGIARFQSSVLVRHNQNPEVSSHKWRDIASPMVPKSMGQMQSNMSNLEHKSLYLHNTRIA